MAPCTKSIQVLAWRILKMFLILFCRIVQRHPLFSAIALIALFLRILLPSIFFFLIYSSPFLFCAALFFLHYNRNSRKPSGKRDDHNLTITEPIREEENGKKGEEGVAEAVFTSDSNEAAVEKSCAWSGGGDAEFENSSTEEDDDKKDGERAALEWTEDDQNNLNDVGISELERNRRLESLIARRRAKRSFDTKEKKSSIGVDVPPAAPMAPVSVSRRNPFEAPDDGAEVEIPHSAPSILLPNKNPFDIPYDPSEEKPDLTSDGFHQEFLAPLEREMLFCRHESFSFTSFALEQPQPRESQTTMLEWKQGKRDHDSLVEHMFSQGGQTLRSKLRVNDLFPQPEPSNLTTKQQEEHGAIETKSGAIKSAPATEATAEDGRKVQVKMTSGSGASSSREDNGGEGPEDGQPAGLPVLEMFIPSSISHEFSRGGEENEPSYDSSPPTAERAVRNEEHLFYAGKGNWHAPTRSIASDLQVEVSEAGSPPLTVDGTASTSDEASLTYDGDVERETTSDSDEMWGGSPDGPRAPREAPVDGERETKQNIHHENFSIHEREPRDVIVSPSFSPPSSSRIDEHETRTGEDDSLDRAPFMDRSTSMDHENGASSHRPQVGSSQPEIFAEQSFTHVIGGEINRIEPEAEMEHSGSSQVVSTSATDVRAMNKDATEPAGMIKNNDGLEIAQDEEEDRF